MKIRRPYLRLIGIVAGVLLILVGAGVTVFWFYFAAPLRHIRDSEWCRAHSTAAYWTEAQKYHRRTGAGVCECCTSYMGLYGDKKWMEWIMTRMQKGKHVLVDSCSEDVLANIANQMPDDGWIKWWERNKTKTQEEWLKDGFARYAIEVHIPPETSEIEPLLALLGNSSTNESERIPGYVRYNAYRWLRDSDFNPVEYAVSNSTESASEVIQKGLVRYYQFEQWCPRKDQVGILAFGKTYGANFSRQPFISTSKVMYTLYAAICLLPMMGVFLIWRVVRRK